jgi:hypothetical protein
LIRTKGHEPGLGFYPVYVRHNAGNIDVRAI